MPESALIFILQDFLRYLTDVNKIGQRFKCTVNRTMVQMILFRLITVRSSNLTVGEFEVFPCLPEFRRTLPSQAKASLTVGAIPSSIPVGVVSPH